MNQIENQVEVPLLALSRGSSDESYPQVIGWVIHSLFISCATPRFSVFSSNCNVRQCPRVCKDNFPRYP